MRQAELKQLKEEQVNQLLENQKKHDREKEKLRRQVSDIEAR